LEEADPLFENAPGDLHLQHASPAQNKGDGDVPDDLHDADADGIFGPGSELTPDLDLAPRNDGCGVDMGAYELPSGPCMWDIAGGDECVGFADLTELLIQWGPCADCSADFNDDGDVGFSDLTTLLVNWGSCPPGEEQFMAPGAAPGLSEQTSSRSPSGGIDPLLIPTGIDSPMSEQQTSDEAPGALASWQAATWLAAGGQDGLLDGTITPEEVAECMDATNGSPFSALMELLAQ
jgi:hypothetical protein